MMEEEKCSIVNLKKLKGSKGAKGLIKGIEKANIVAFGVSISPCEKFWYLTEDRDILYCYDLSGKEEMKFDRSSRDGPAYLTKPNQEPFDYLRTFNEDMYVVLGNKKFIHIFHATSNGKL